VGTVLQPLAFNLPRGGPYLAEVRSRIPTGLDVLVTHAPAFGRLDRTRSGEHVGCERLAERLEVLEAEGADPHLHVHGDIHEAAGVHAPPFGAEGRITVNAAVLDASYGLTRPPVTIDV
jgi:Icc-related predicted phosphoesterase